LARLRKVKLDVGGKLFVTSLTTLCSKPDSMLASMFSGRFALEKDTDGSYFIDRNGEYFGYPHSCQFVLITKVHFGVA
jgi:hypothetical protein